MNKKGKIYLNRLRIFLAERNISNKELAEQIGKDESTISKYSTNTVQPSLHTLYEIAELFDVDLKDLIESTRPKK